MRDNDTHDRSSTRRDVLRGLGVMAATAIGSGSALGSNGESAGDGAVYQYYHTRWPTIRENLEAVAAAGYDAIQVPPAQSSRLYWDERRSGEEAYDVPLGYQPIDFRDFDSEFGTEAEYRAMVDEAHDQGLAVIADAVVNHVAAGGDTFRRTVTLEDVPQFTAADFHDRCEIDYSDDESVEDCWLVGLRDLKQERASVRRALYDYVEKYAELGVDGIRFDAAKHVPEWFFRDYATNWTDDLGLSPVGEVLDGSRSYCRQYAATGMAVTDYPLYFTMKEEVFDPDGDMTALDGAGLVDATPSRALTFVSNHDSPPPEYERLAYAYVLTYEGQPRVYNHRIGVDDESIRRLLSIRRELLEGEATTRYLDSQLYVYERGEALVALNRGRRRRSQVVETGFDAGETLSDRTGSAPDVEVGSDGSVELSVPAVGYAVYSPRPVDGGEDGDSGDDGCRITTRFEGTLDEGGDGRTHEYATRTVDPRSISVDLAGPQGADVDLYLTLDGTEPSRSDHDRRSWSDGSDESIELSGDDVAGDSTLGILVRSYRGGGEYEVVVEETGDECDDGSDEGGDPDEDAVTLRVEAPVPDGESVYFTGSTDELTDWGTGIEGTLSDGTWAVTVEPTGDFEWKTRRGPAGGRGEVWEVGDNHDGTTPAPTHRGWADGFDGDDGSGDGGDEDREEEPSLRSGRTYAITNVASGRSLEVDGGSTANGADVRVSSPTSGHDTHWILEELGDGYYRLLATHSGRVLDVEAVSTAEGANVHQWEYVGGDNQQWAIEETDGGFLVRARHSGKVLTASGTEPGASVRQRSETGSDRQVWSFTEL